jgi:hypothetical protein
MAKHDDATYIGMDPFFGDEAERTCRSVIIRTARRPHLCFGLDGVQDHYIASGQRYRFERARIDGSFWGEYKICLECMDRHIAEYA